MRSSRSRPAKRSRARAAGGGGDLADLIALSRAIGADPDQVQGSGGNTSIKSRDGRRMLVKASGIRLADVAEERGWAEVGLEGIRAAVADADLAAAGAAAREAEVARRLESCVVRSAPGARASVDTFLHSLLGRAVVHTHPIGLNALLASRASRARWRAELADPPCPALYIPYVDPGFTLARRLHREIAAWIREHGSAPEAVLLENHGLFVSADDPDACLDLARAWAAAGRKWIGRERVNPVEFPPVVAVEAATNGAGVLGPLDAPEPELRGALLRGGAAACVLRRDTSDVARELLAKDDLAVLARRGAFTPDQISYCGEEALILAASPARWVDAISAYRARWGKDPRVIIVRRKAIYYAAADLARLRAVAETFRGAIAALLASPRAGGPRFLSRAQAAFVAGWESKLPASKEGRAQAAVLAGRIAAVTGAGSGLGRAISAGIIAAGGTVVGLDLDREGLDETARSHDAGRFLGVGCNVTDEASVQDAFRSILASAGGLDFLVNAAGIAPAFPLVEFPVNAWRKTLEVNLTGYFLCAREAARVLLRQGAGGAILNLSSKSGLEASKANSAYNATKSGEIHLARGWALELGAAGIRVNSIAPGNVFKGSKIWNDEYIRVCARKRGIRPEEVIPYYTSLSALGKEIEPQDIAAAAVFLLSDAARNITGQTLVIDGGQVMVR